MRSFILAVAASIGFAACGGLDDRNLNDGTSSSNNNNSSSSNDGGSGNNNTNDTSGDNTCRNSGGIVSCPSGRACNGTLVMYTTAPSGRSLEMMEMDPIKPGETLAGPYWETIQNVSGTSVEISMAGGGATQVLVQARATGDSNDGKWDAYGHGPTAHLTMNTTVRCGGETMSCGYTWSPPGGISAGSARLCVLP